MIEFKEIRNTRSDAMSIFVLPECIITLKVIFDNVKNYILLGGLGGLAYGLLLKGIRIHFNGDFFRDFMMVCMYIGFPIVVLQLTILNAIQTRDIVLSLVNHFFLSKLERDSTGFLRGILYIALAAICILGSFSFIGVAAIAAASFVHRNS